MKKTFFSTILIVLVFVPQVVFGAITPGEGGAPMKLLSGFPGIYNAANGNVSIVPFLNALFNILLIGAAILAVIFIVLGGFEIMTKDTPFHISEGKDRIRSALVGLFIILGSYVILYTINPDLIRLDIFKTLEQYPVNAPGEGGGTGSPTSPTGAPTTPTGTPTGGPTGGPTAPPPPPPVPTA